MKIGMNTLRKTLTSFLIGSSFFAIANASMISPATADSTSTALIAGGVAGIVGALLTDPSNHRQYYVRNNRRYYVTSQQAHQYNAHRHQAPQQHNGHAMQHGHDDHHGH